jgi:uncharacterized protein
MPDGSERAKPSASQALLESVLDQLACPACHSGLRIEESRLVCSGCGRVYPVVDGIPVLIAEHRMDASPTMANP